MNKKLREAHMKFVMHFHYAPEFPSVITFDEDAFADELLKCVEDGIDYTIEKYGTVPPKSFERASICYD